MNYQICSSPAAAYMSSLPVSERRDDQSVGVSQVLIAELELGVTDVNITLSGFIIPAMA